MVRGVNFCLGAESFFGFSKVLSGLNCLDDVISPIALRMHRLPSDSIVRKFRLAAVMVAISFIGIPLLIGLLFAGVFAGVFAGEVPVIRASIWCLGGSLLFIGWTLIVTGWLKCPLCRTPPLQRRGCSKHRTAKKLIGSYRLKVAQSILFKDRFKCPYCGELTKIEARRRRRGR